MKIDDLIGEAETKAAAIYAACCAMAQEAEYAAVVGPADGAAECATRALAALKQCRLKLEHSRRPKGPMVSMEWVGFHANPEERREVLRRTAAYVVLYDWHEERFALKDGEPVGGKKTHASRIRGFRTGVDRWRIRSEDLELIRAMPIGENDVSRALKALEKAT